jgi:uncharacterized protein YjiS (DUF1127 family)
MISTSRAGGKQRRRTTPAEALLAALAEPRHRGVARGLSHLSDAVLEDIGISRADLLADTPEPGEIA